MKQRRVVVTGLGMISPLGLDVETTWAGIVAGRSGITSIDNFDVSKYPTRFGGPIRDFDVTRYMSAKEAKRFDPFVHYGVAAAVQAVSDSGYELSDEYNDRVGVAVGSGIGGIGTILKTCASFHDSDYSPKKVSPFFIPSSIANMAAGQISIQLNLHGPNIAAVSACTTGVHNIGLAARMIAYGDADAMVAGGCEMAVNPIGLAGFCSAKALSTRNDDPTAASRPWDVDRDGFVLSDGAGVLMLEELESAKARGAKIYGEVAGFGMSGDAHHITMPSGRGSRQCMINALADAEMTGEDIDYINAHGTSTQAGDVSESRSIEAVMGSAAHKVAVSSTKSMTGHMLGAAGSAEAIFALLAIRDQVAPPTINLDNPDEGCTLDYVPHTAREMKIDVALSNSFGFGGTNGSLILKRFA
ncbi:beta-ketoacyl-ACP synthase II [Salinisphaera hydrothermalis]|uniref:3-oxoacyl-[acyl-carrier-protein] synthase 2 n=1 Tax=Salinisphaera hydrothermalis (strain C41B8) TaxID=1304275 RepID=A0A084IQH4_SALHC|nr:beta-ketoacyl-ACP synthase II [Salinisphaera hydrothermalis]KEZ78958.1 3-oxoacyl-(acyl carrier protein) synthase II [Salinisphaera hydrothermalis C41B8]